MKSANGRIAITLVLVVVLEIAIALVVADRSYRQVLDSVAADTVAMAQREYDALRVDRTERMSIALEVVTRSEEVASAFEARDREGLLRVARPIYDELNRSLGISRLYFFEDDAEQTVFLRAYTDRALLPSAFGDRSNSPAAARSAATGKRAAGLELGRRALALRVVAPFQNESGDIIGYVSLAETMDDHLAAISRQTGNEYALFMSKKGLDHEAWASAQASAGRPDTWDAYQDVVLTEQTLIDPAQLEPLPDGPIPTEPKTLGYVTHDQAKYVAGTFPLFGEDGSTVGQVFVLHDVTALAAALRQSQLSLIVALLALTIVGALAVGVVVNHTVVGTMKVVTDRVEEMTLAVASGDWTGLETPEEAARDKDGFEAYFEDFMNLIAGVLKAREENHRQ